MVEIVCPSCHSHAVLAVFAESTRCSTCGCLLSSSPDEPAVVAGREDDLLMEDLREAFGVGTQGLGSHTQASPEMGLRRGSAGAIARDSAELTSGSRLGDFEILDELGRGGMGIVYRARQTSLNRDVALKILPGAAWRGGSAVIRFRREAQAAARLNHANVVPIYAQGEHEGSYYYAMKLIDGVTLDTALRTRPELLSSNFAFPSTFPALRSDYGRGAGSAVGVGDAPGSADVTSDAGPIVRTGADFQHLASLMAGVAEGLAHAHESGVIHRDIKPRNLILGEGGRLYIADFGLAHVSSDPHLTVTGEIMGTPAYLSPEQVRGDVGAIDHRTDIYSLGVTLYELLTKRRPFGGETREQLLHAICSAQPCPPRKVDPRIPVDLITICQRAMERESARRYPTARALAEDLHRFAEGRPILSRRVSLMEKAVKWVRRHKALTVASVAIATALALSAGWAVSTTAENRRQGNALLRSTYDGLVHTDYDRTSEAKAALAQAEALGADDPISELVSAIVSIRRSDGEEAIDRLTRILESDPENTEAAYMLAWAQRRSERDDQARVVLQRAEELGGPQTAEEWFFRALALHIEDPVEAFKSYDTAVVLRSEDNLFFPQAELHLARIANQRMYATRTLDTFEQAELALRSLIRLKHHRAFPYYLLSITYRIAGEIHLFHAQEVSESKAQEYFKKALANALEGQELYPEDAQLPTTAARCLEGMGRFEEALASRGRAIELAELHSKRRENYHYRWRLHYWLGDLDDALQDIEDYVELLPDTAGSLLAARAKLNYTHLYPALVHADGGDLEYAVDLVREAADQASPDPQPVLLSAAFLRILGRPDEANEMLANRRDDVEFAGGLRPHQFSEWVEALYAFASGEASFETLEELAEDSPYKRRLMGEAYFHAGAMALAAGERQQARSEFERAYRSFDGSKNLSYCGRIILGQLEGHPDWPGWIPIVPGD